MHIVQCLHIHAVMRSSLRVHNVKTWKSGRPAFNLSKTASRALAPGMFGLYMSRSCHALDLPCNCVGKQNGYPALALYPLVAICTACMRRAEKSTPFVPFFPKNENLTVSPSRRWGFRLCNRSDVHAYHGAGSSEDSCDLTEWKRPSKNQNGNPSDLADHED